MNEHAAAFNAGSDARLAGVPITRCPIPHIHTTERWYWCEGWRQCDREWGCDARWATRALPVVEGVTL